VLRVRAGVVVFLCSVAVAQLHAQRPQLWYQAYDAGVADVRRGAWDSAVQNLQAAKQRGPQPARRVVFYGDRVDTFNPDYYLGIAYLNLRRFADADAAFERVRQANLIAANDSLFRTFQSEASRAKFELALSQADDYLSKGDLGQAKAAGDRANALGVDATRTAALQQRVAEASAQITSANNAPTPAPAPFPVPEPPAPIPTTQPGPVPLPVPPSPSPSPKPPVPEPPPPPTPPPPRPIPSINTGIETGIAAYLSGRYSDAAAILAVTAATNSPDVVRARFYLACSLAALFLSGEGDEAELDNARAALQMAGRVEQFAADRRIISPRVLAALGVQP